jgi:hypothetical protein
MPTHISLRLQAHLQLVDSPETEESRLGVSTVAKACASERMRTGIAYLTDDDRQRLDAIVADRNTAHKHVWRARIMLLSADVLGSNAIMGATDKAKTSIRRWQERFATESRRIAAGQDPPPGKP